MKITTGIFDTGRESGGITQLLRQEKTPFEVVEGPSDCPVVLFEGCFPDWAYRFMENGGVAVVLGAGRSTFNFDSGFVAPAAVEHLDLSFCGQGRARIASMVNLFRGEGLGSMTMHENRVIHFDMYPGFFPVFLWRAHGRGGVFYTGVPMSALLTAAGDTLRRVNDLTELTERVSSIDKPQLEGCLRRVLSLAFQKAGLPYLRLWYYPDDAPSVFAFRIDGDGMEPDGMDALIDSSREAGVPYTLYISESSAREKPVYIESLRRAASMPDVFELGSHAGLHNLYDSYEDNLQNLLSMERWMEDIGVAFDRVFCAPRGMYNPNLGRALSALGYRHSSDFGLSYGGLPFHPYLEGEQVGPVQVPVDGFNVARLTTFCGERNIPMHSAADILDYYLQAARQKISRGTPVIFFCHPHAYGRLSREIFPPLAAEVRQWGVAPTTMTRYGDFWLRRDAVRYTAELRGGELVIEGDVPADISVQVLGAAAPLAQPSPVRLHAHRAPNFE